MDLMTRIRRQWVARRDPGARLCPCARGRLRLICRPHRVHPRGKGVVHPSLSS